MGKQNEDLVKSLQTSDLLVSDLRQLASKSIVNNDRALNILAREMLESAVKIMQKLNELV